MWGHKPNNPLLPTLRGTWCFTAAAVTLARTLTVDNGCLRGLSGCSDLFVPGTEVTSLALHLAGETAQGREEKWRHLTL